MEPNKSELRRSLRVKRDEFVGGLGERDRALCFSCPPSPLARLFERQPVVAGYIAMGSEVDPHKLLQAAHEAGCTVALPYVQSKTQPMRFLRHEWGAPLIEGPFGLMQPDAAASPITPDLVLLPLVGFDRDGNRLGQGAGHYDRALSLLPDAIRIGLGWACQEIVALPADPWDEPLHAICTEKEWITP
jgi:5-formyltetrahydrofolate cyclo-ligase